LRSTAADKQGELAYNSFAGEHRFQRQQSRPAISRARSMNKQSLIINPYSTEDLT
jgi:hypothetical protein